MVRSATNTVFAIATVFVANVAVALDVDKVTLSPLKTPDSAAEFLFSSAVAESVALYSRLLAVMPVTVSSFAKIDALVVGWVSV